MKTVTIWGHAQSAPEEPLPPLASNGQSVGELQEALACCVAQLEAMYAEKERGADAAQDEAALLETCSSLEAQVATHLEERDAELRELDRIYEYGNRLEARARKMVAALAAAIEE